VHPGKIRFRSPQSIFEEIREIRTNFDIHDIRFVDDVFTVNQRIVSEFLDLVLSKGESFDWMCCGRVDRIDEPTLRKMKQAGCYRIEYGIESGNGRVIQFIEKGATLKQATDAITVTRQAGIESIANFILGFPTETEEEMKRTLDFSIEADPDFAIYFPFTPFTGSRLAEDFNLEWDPRKPAFRGESPSYKVPTEKVMELVDRGYSRFYFRPKTVFRRLLSIRSGWILWDLFRMALTHLFGK
jgi:radical SAM superfamily enzyme YgiQ (UPF0313 family)